MHKKEFKKLGGYFTVEAGLIVPVVIFLISFIFYMTFYLYNRCVVSQDVYILAFRGSACGSSLTQPCMERGPEEIKQYIMGQCAGQYGKKYMGINSFISTIKADKSNVTVEAFGTVTPAFTEELLPQKEWRFYAKGEAQRICPTECVRKVRLIKRISGK